MEYNKCYQPDRETEQNLTNKLYRARPRKIISPAQLNRRSNKRFSLPLSPHSISAARHGCRPRAALPGVRRPRPPPPRSSLPDLRLRLRRRILIHPAVPPPPRGKPSPPRLLFHFLSLSIPRPSAFLRCFSQSFDRGYYLLVKAIQELRARKDGHIVTVGIGGPTGSGKTRYGGDIIRSSRSIALILGRSGDFLVLLVVLCSAALRRRWPRSLGTS